MPFHLIAFAPFILFVGLSMMLGAVSLIVRLISPKVRLTVSAATMAVPRRSAEVLPFPAPKARPVGAERPLDFPASASNS